MQLNSTYLPRSSKCFPIQYWTTLWCKEGKSFHKTHGEKKAFYTYTRIWLLIKNYRKCHNDWTRGPASKEFPLTETVGGTRNEVWLSIVILAPTYCWFCTNCPSNEVCFSYCFCFLIFINWRTAYPEYVWR